MIPGRALAVITAYTAAATLAAAPAQAAAEFGANVHAPHVQHLRDIEQVAGRQMDSTRMFLRWDSPWPHDLVAVKDRLRLMVSVQAIRTNGTRISWAAIAAAQPGTALYADMVRWADRFKALGVPIFLTFNHEASTLRAAGSGGPADFKAAYVKFRSVMLARGVTNARFVWIETSHSFKVASTDRRYAPKWYPGNAAVDLIAADAYNWYRCRTDGPTPWREFPELAGPVLRFAAQHGKRVYFTEVGSVEDPAVPGRKARFIEGMGDYVQTHPAIAGVAWYAVPGAQEGERCDWRPNSGVLSAEAWRRVGRRVYFGGAG